MSQVTFGIEELKAIRKYLEVLTKRGAFEVHEIGEVGIIYNRLHAFVTAAEAAMEEQKNQTSEAVISESNVTSTEV